MNHLTEEQLFALADGGVAPNRESALRTHLHGCAECRSSLDEIQQLVTDLGAQDAFDEDAHVRGVMATLAERRASSKSASPSSKLAGRKWLAPAASALALAAAVLLLLRSRAPVTHDEFTARGAASESTLSRDVGVRVFSSTSHPKPLERGAVVAPDASFTGGYRNVHPKAVYLLLFAIDSSHAVHWLYPAYKRADENPASVLLERSERERLLPTSVVLDGPADGRLRILAVVSEQPLHVQDIEKRKPDEIDRSRLEQLFSAAVTETIVDVKK